MDKIWYRTPSKSEVIGRCSGDEKTEWPRRTDKGRTLPPSKTKQNNNNNNNNPKKQQQQNKTKQKTQTNNLTIINKYTY